MSDPVIQTRLVFGRDRDTGVAEEVVGHAKGGTAKANPCLVVYGPGPEGTTCKSCVHLYAQRGVAGHYLKCELRRNTRGPGTDHRAGWPSCAKYEAGR